jgi:ribose 1,5-bisphosphokinase PhnN
MGKLFFVIGASGAGKTSALKQIENMHLPNLKIFYFDSIGVPSFQEMEKECGSTDEWQRIMTTQWIRRMKDEEQKDTVILDAQTRPSFIIDACKSEKVEFFEIILFDCSDEVRRKRLEARGQPELADDRMMSWARYLREACRGGICNIIDNSNKTVEESVTSLVAQLQKSL